MFSHRPTSKANLPLIIVIGTLGGVSIGISLGIQSYGYDVVGRVFNWEMKDDGDIFGQYKSLLAITYISGIVMSSFVFWLFKFSVRNMVTIGHMIALFGSFIASISFEKFSFGTGMFLIGFSYPFLYYSPFYIIEALSGSQKYIPLHHIGIAIGLFVSSSSSIYFANYDHNQASIICKSLWRFLFLLPCLNSILAVGLIANFANSTDTVRGTEEELKSYRSLKYPEKNIIQYFKEGGNIVNLIYISLYAFCSNIGVLFLSITHADDFLSAITPNYYLHFHVIFLFAIAVGGVLIFYLQSVHPNAGHIVHIVLNTVIIVISAIYISLFSEESTNAYFKYTVACLYILNYVSSDGPILYKFFFRLDMFAYQKVFISLCTIFSWGGAILIYLLGYTRFSVFTPWFIGIIIAFSGLSIIFSTLLQYNFNFACKGKVKAAVEKTPPSPKQPTPAADPTPAAAPAAAPADDPAPDEDEEE